MGTDFGAETRAQLNGRLTYIESTVPESTDVYCMRQRSPAEMEPRQAAASPNVEAICVKGWISDEQQGCHEVSRVRVCARRLVMIEEPRLTEGGSLVENPAATIMVLVCNCGSCRISTVHVSTSLVDVVAHLRTHAPPQSPNGLQVSSLRRRHRKCQARASTLSVWGNEYKRRVLTIEGWRSKRWYHLAWTAYGADGDGKATAPGKSTAVAVYLMLVTCGVRWPLRLILLTRAHG